MWISLSNLVGNLAEGIHKLRLRSFSWIWKCEGQFGKI